MESLRLRSRDLPALQFFKEMLEDRIGVQADEGVLAFSLIKHTLLLLLGVFFVANAVRRAWPCLGKYSRGGVVRLAHHAGLDLCFCAGAVSQNQRPLAAAAWRPHYVWRCCWSGRWQRFSASSSRWWNWPSSTPPDEEAPGSNGDIEALISAGEEEGLIEKDDRKLIESVVAFGDKTVREVMTPRPKIVAIEASRTAGRFARAGDP